MKSCRILTVFIFLSLSPAISAQYSPSDQYTQAGYLQSDGSDTCYELNCFYKMREEGIQKTRQEQQQQLETYRNQLLSVQQAQLAETQKQNALLEQQLQDIDRRQQQLEDSQTQPQKQAEEEKLYEQAPANDETVPDDNL